MQEPVNSTRLPGTLWSTYAYKTRQSTKPVKLLRRLYLAMISTPCKHLVTVIVHETELEENVVTEWCAAWKCWDKSDFYSTCDIEMYIFWQTNAFRLIGRFKQRMVALVWPWVLSRHKMSICLGSVCYVSTCIVSYGNICVTAPYHKYNYRSPAALQWPHLYGMRKSYRNLWSSLVNIRKMWMSHRK